MMETFIQIVLILSALAVIPAFAASIYSSYVLNRYLRQTHPGVWAKISPAPQAEPSLSSPNTRFVTQRTYRALKDGQLNRLGDRCFNLLYLAVSMFLALVLSGLISSALS